MTEHETQTSKGSPLLTGMFRDRDSAERAYSCVTQRGYTKDDVTPVSYTHLTLPTIYSV